jgi:hypothetical protein
MTFALYVKMCFSVSSLDTRDEVSASTVRVHEAAR